MTEENRKSYPSIPANNWWALRRKFRSTIPREVTPTYIASALTMDADSARKNVLPSLRLVGLLDKENKPTDLAVRWRDDSQYPNVCKDIFDRVYPQELKDLAPDTTVDKSVVQSWFANHLKVGEVAARKLTSFYFLLLDANLQKDSESTNTTGKAKIASSRRRRTSAVGISTGASGKYKDKQVEDEIEVPAPSIPITPTKVSAGLDRLTPQIHFNIQVVLPENASADTYDAIFRSIATHLLGRNEE